MKIQSGRDVSQWKAFIRDLEQKPSTILANSGYNLNVMDSISTEKYPCYVQYVII